MIDRDGEHLAALIHDPALLDEPELLDSVARRPGIALENGRLHAELKARLEELRGSRGAGFRGRTGGAQATGAQPPRRRAAAIDRALARARAAGGASSTRPDEARARVEQARREIAVSLEELRAVARGHPSGGRQRARTRSRTASSSRRRHRFR